MKIDGFSLTTPMVVTKLNKSKNDSTSTESGKKKVKLVCSSYNQDYMWNHFAKHEGTKQKNDCG